MNIDIDDLVDTYADDEDIEYDRRAVEAEYGLEDGELDGVSIRDAEDILGLEEGELDSYKYVDDTIKILKPHMYESEGAYVVDVKEDDDTYRKATAEEDGTHRRVVTKICSQRDATIWEPNENTHTADAVTWSKP
mgnify:CR=1 FL=1